MASRDDKASDERVSESSWEEEKRRKRLSNRKKDSGPSGRRGGPEKGKKRMSRPFSDRSDEGNVRSSWRDVFADADDDIDLSDLDGDFDSDTDPDDDLDGEDLEDSGIDYSLDS